MSTEPTFRLTVRSVPGDGRPLFTRLRIAAKYLLRSQGLRIVSIEELLAADSGAGAGVAVTVGCEEGDKGGA